MPRGTENHRIPHFAYAGLDFIKAAFCPLEFNAMPLKKHPDWAMLRKDEGLAGLEVSDALRYPRQFPYTDVHGHRKVGTQIITSVFGLAPADFDLFLGLFTYLKKLPEIPVDGRTYLTVDFIARQLSLPATCQKDYLRIRSRIFRLSYTKYTNSAFWNSEDRSYDIVNFGLFNLAALSRLTESRRPIKMDWDPTLLRLLKSTAVLAFDYEFYRSLGPALRRLYLIANRDGWNQRDSGIFMADDFTIHQIGYSQDPALTRLRMQKLKKLLRDAEERDIIRPYAPWHGYLQRLNQGPRQGQLALRWSRGPALRVRRNASANLFTDSVENDALYAQVRELRDEDGKPVSPDTHRRLAAKYGHQLMQKHIVVILAQKEHHPGSFTKSELAAYINRLQHDHPEPDWYQDLKRAERLSPFEKVQPNKLSKDVYETLFK